MALTRDAVHSPHGLMSHCQVASLLMTELDPGDPAVKHHIRGAIREATKKVTDRAGANLKAIAEGMSRRAAAKMEDGDFSDLVAEHSVPVSFINHKVLQLSNPTPERISEVVLTYTEWAVITREEHRLLKMKGLHTQMPDDWDERDKRIRYKLVGIEIIEPNRYHELRQRHRTS